MAPAPPARDGSAAPDREANRAARRGPSATGNPFGRRRRRLRRAAGLLAAAGAVALVGGVLAWRASRPEVRRPGEALPDITTRLAHDVPAEAPTPDFTDATAAAGLDGFRTFAGERTSQLPEDMGSGAAWGDFDGDGDDDLFLVAAGGALSAPPERWAESMLYENSGAGTFRRVETFPATRIVGMGAAWGDADGDGDLDLAVSGYRALRLFRNSGGGRFEPDPRFVERDGYWAGLAWGDFDRDGDLDLYVCGYVRYLPPPPGERRVTQQYGKATPYTLNPASYEPESNLLLENRGDGTFDEVAVEWGVSNPAGRSLSALWHDLDDDGRLDLYVANDISDNALFLNRGDTFEDAGLAAWVADYRGAMGLAVGDRDRDGDDDLFVTHWLAQENAFYDSRLRQGRALDAARGLLADRDPAARLTFSDLSAPLGVGQISLPMVGWGTEMLDFDADGWLDVAVTNGSTIEATEDPQRLVPQAPFLLWSARGERFHDLAPRVPALAPRRVGRGLAVSDYDRDGDLDLLVVHLDGGVQLLRNDTPQGRAFELRLRQRLPLGGFGRAEGATVVAWVGGVPLRRSVTGVSYLSQSTRTLHFGLGGAERAERIEVRWPDGDLAIYGAVDAGALWELTQGETEARRLSALSPAAAAAPASSALGREQVLEFWATHRAGMDALKRDRDCGKAAERFRRALELDSGHEDARYYLAHCLWARGDAAGALAELDEMRRRAPMSLRAHRQWAAFAAATAVSAADLDAAEAAAARAVEINGEDSGGMLLLGEISLLRGRTAEAGRQFALACRSNPRAVDGLFLGAFVAWRGGDDARARELLAAARAARGEDWKPEGTTAEGDVTVRIQREETPLAVYWRRWDGESESLAAAFAPIVDYLAARASRSSS